MLFVFRGFAYRGMSGFGLRREGLTRWAKNAINPTDEITRRGVAGVGAVQKDGRSVYRAQYMAHQVLLRPYLWR